MSNFFLYSLLAMKDFFLNALCKNEDLRLQMLSSLFH